MIPEFKHNIGERLFLVRPEISGKDTYVRIRRLSDGHYFSYTDSEFVDTLTPDNSEFNTLMLPLFDTPLVSTLIAVLPPIQNELLILYVTATESTEYEIHKFGGTPMVYEPARCLLFGYLRDVGGNPIPGQRVDVSLNRGGYFPHKSGLIGTSVTTTTDNSGYFELSLVPGLDVVVSIPTIGYVKRGIVPSKNSVELTELLGRV